MEFPTEGSRPTQLPIAVSLLIRPNAFSHSGHSDGNELSSYTAFTRSVLFYVSLRRPERSDPPLSALASL